MEVLAAVLVLAVVPREAVSLTLLEQTALLVPLLLAVLVGLLQWGIYPILLARGDLAALPPALPHLAPLAVRAELYSGLVE
jgi:hypothetical protein